MGMCAHTHIAQCVHCHSLHPQIFRDGSSVCLVYYLPCLGLRALVIRPHLLLGCGCILAWFWVAHLPPQRLFQFHSVCTLGGPLPLPFLPATLFLFSATLLLLQSGEVERWPL